VIGKVCCTEGSYQEHCGGIVHAHFPGFVGMLAEINKTVIKNRYTNNAEDAEKDHSQGIWSEIHQLGHIEMCIFIYCEGSLQYTKKPGQQNIVKVVPYKIEGQADQERTD
jgi:hypothetical protein